MNSIIAELSLLKFRKPTISQSKYLLIACLLFPLLGGATDTNPTLLSTTNSYWLWAYGGVNDHAPETSPTKVLANATSLDFTNATNGNNGPEDFVELPDISALSNGTNFTIEFRLTITQISSFMPIFVKRSADVTQVVQIQLAGLSGNPGNRFSVNMSNGGMDNYYRESSVTPVVNGGTYFVALVFDGNQPAASRLKLY